jgi:hypothetical protein
VYHIRIIATTKIAMQSVMICMSGSISNENDVLPTKPIIFNMMKEAITWQKQKQKQRIHFATHLSTSCGISFGYGKSFMYSISM